MASSIKTRSRAHRKGRSRSPSRRRAGSPKLGNFKSILIRGRAIDDDSKPEPPVTPITPISPNLGDLEKLYISPAKKDSPEKKESDATTIFSGSKELRRGSVPDSPTVPGTLEHLRRSLVATIGCDPNPAVAELPPARFRLRQEREDRRRASSSSEDDSYVRDDFSLADGLSSPALTTATSPESSPRDSKDDQDQISDLEGNDKRGLNGDGLEPNLSTLLSITSPLPIRLPPGTTLDHHGRLRQITAKGEMLPLFGELQQARRMQITQVAASPRMSSAAEDVWLPWDTNGKYLPGLEPKGLPTSWSHRTGWQSQYRLTSDPDHISRSRIEPLYAVNKPTQLSIIKAIQDDTYGEDDLLRAHPQTKARATQPIHVFVDASNIIIGFYEAIKQARFITEDLRVPAPNFFYEGFAAAIERGRPCAKRIFAGSTKPGITTPGYMLDAATLGYEMNILQRVKGSKKVRETYNAANPGGLYIPESWDNAYREQGVDELLQLKMLQTLTDSTEPGIMVVATGDASAAEFSDGFHKHVVRALERGWLIEVVGFSANMSKAWFDDAFLKKWALQLRVFFLDCLREELLASYPH